MSAILMSLFPAEGIDMKPINDPEVVRLLLRYGYPIFLVLIGIGGAALMTNMAALALGLRPDLRQAVAGVFNGSRFLGLMLGPVLITPIYEVQSIRGVLLVAALILLATAVITRWVKPAA